MSTNETKSGRKLWKAIPGVAISAFFLWWALKDIHYSTFREMHFAVPVWIPIGFAFLALGYTLRIYRWWVMLQPNGGASFAESGRVLLTSFAANNVMPFRIGDFLRVFAYAGDLKSSPSAILSTVILERLLDVATLLTVLAIALTSGAASLPALHVFHRDVNWLSFILPLLAFVGLAVLCVLFAARPLQRLLQGLLRMLPKAGFVAKLEKSVEQALQAVLTLGSAAKLLIVALSAAVWFCEGMIFVSAANLLALSAGTRGPWLALALSNLSYLIPSSPGAVGTFETFSKLGMTSQGARPDVAALFGLLVHVVVLFTVTLAGGIAFLVHRSHRVDPKPLLQEMEALPEELPQQ